MALRDVLLFQKVECPFLFSIPRLDFSPDDALGAGFGAADDPTGEIVAFELLADAFGEEWGRRPSPGRGPC